MTDRIPRPRRHGAVLGAAVGAIVGLVVILIVDRFFAGAQNDTYWLPAGIVVGIFAGGMIGLGFAETVIGGREDEAATAAARESVAEESARHAPDPPA